MGLLDELLGEGKKYLRDAMPGGLLNPEVSAQSALDGAAIASSPVPVLGDLLGLGADLHRYAKQPEERTMGNFALSGLGLLPFVPSMTAWHGSPHKFDKFSLDKIGTGEGAQAYGHGLYLAESPEVAGIYRSNLAKDRPSINYDKFITGNKDSMLFERYLASSLDNYFSGALQYSENPTASLLAKSARDELNGYADHFQEFPKKAARFAKEYKLDAGTFISKIRDAASKIDESYVKPPGALYKVDLPDEHLSRFLDWDKPLSQQAPEVQKFVSQNMQDNIARAQESAKRIGLDFDPNSITGKDIYSWMTSGLKNSPDGASALNAQGIPGIRYLDGGSRSAGQGSSNFVAFDPDMIRILERNGQATGLQPWKPGEYRLGDLLK